MSKERRRSKERRSNPSRVTPAELVEEAVPWMLGSLPATAPSQDQATATNNLTYDDGFRAGLANGIEKGIEQARVNLAAEQQVQEAARVDFIASSARLSELTSSFASELSRFESALAQKMLDTCVSLAQKVVACEVQTNKDVILSVIKQSLEPVGDVLEHLILVVNPADLPIIQEATDTGKLATFAQLRSDPTIEPGGCHIESALLEIDASLHTRWQRALDSIGQNTDALTESPQTGSIDSTEGGHES